MQEQLHEMYQRLYAYFGPQHWWPGEGPFEIMVGAVLTQNTNWGNVEKAIDNLKRAGILSLTGMSSLPQALIAEYIRPAGYYNIKAGRLLNLFDLIRDRYSGDLEQLFSEDTEILRQSLLSVKGIGPETADSILLYAGNYPVFVVDAYTYRVLIRHDLIVEDFGYDEIQEFFMENLPLDADLFNEFHALLVRVGKEFCKKKRPRCESCPLHGL